MPFLLLVDFKELPIFHKVFRLTKLSMTRADTATGNVSLTADAKWFATGANFQTVNSHSMTREEITFIHCLGDGFRHFTIATPG
jgi:hypothetical protein